MGSIYFSNMFLIQKQNRDYAMRQCSFKIEIKYFLFNSIITYMTIKRSGMRMKILRLILGTETVDFTMPEYLGNVDPLTHTFIL